jgi:hypothetical protein
MQLPLRTIRAGARRGRRGRRIAAHPEDKLVVFLLTGAVSGVALQ